MIVEALYITMYTVSTSLLYPVILSLIVLVVYSLMKIGELVAESARRSRDFNVLREICKTLKFREALEELSKMNLNRLLRDFVEDLKRINPTKEDIEKILQDYELRIAKELEIPRILARIGPMLGLMGTLIPLGPALMALSEGNVEQLATNLITAFATTVLGLIVGGVGYVSFLIKKRWYLQDLSDMEYISKTLGGFHEEINRRD
uniref:MotA/TolQ/ExbB proton channel family protein n=1 Tax=Geoglobus ahangari TaxID=113653 RepID=A0A7C4W341_9EURY